MRKSLKESANEEDNEKAEALEDLLDSLEEAINSVEECLDTLESTDF